MKTKDGAARELDLKSKAEQWVYTKSSNWSYLPSQHPYNLSISHEKRYIWYRVAKVGTRTILKHLKNFQGKLDVVHAGGIRYPVNRYEDYYKFAFVRNPWDRLVSSWTNKVVETNYFDFSPEVHEEMKEFKNFVDFVSQKNIERCDRHIRAQSALIDLNNLDYLGRMESFVHDFNQVLTTIEVKKMKTKRENRTSRESYQSYYDGELREKVGEIYKKDIQIFGYKFD